MTYVRAADAAYASNIPGGFDIAGGYYGGPDAYHVWPAADWRRFPGNKLPIWVGGQDGPGEGVEAVALLHQLGVPEGVITVLDMETRVDVQYVDNFVAELWQASYKVWVYGSASSVFRNPPANGYWVADYTTDMAQIDALLQAGHVRAVQFQADTWPGYDVSLVKMWTEGRMWR